MQASPRVAPHPVTTLTGAFDIEHLRPVAEKNQTASKKKL
jgi:hypothetical protein